MTNPTDREEGFGMKISQDKLIDMQGTPTELLIVGQPLPLAIKTNGAALHFPPGADYVKVLHEASTAFWEALYKNCVKVKAAP